MAKYDITSLNYLASGNGRTFINMDTKLVSEARITVFLLRKECPRNEFDPLSSNIITEQKEGKYTDIGYICRDFNDSGSAARFLVTQQGIATVFTDVGLENDIANSLAENGLDERNALSREGNGEKARESLILDENRTEFKETGNKRMMIRLQTATDTKQYHENVRKFNEKHIVHNNRTFVFDSYIDGCADSSVNSMSEDGEKPMYDMVDVCVKSSNVVAEQKIVSMDMKGSRTEDIYVPQYKEDPVQFVQSGKHTYVMFGDTQTQEGIIESSLKSERDGLVGSQYYTVGIRTDGNSRTNLYASPKEIAETQDFSNRIEMDGIRYNYMAQIDSNSESRGSYTNGNQYGSIYQLKNAYDSNYCVGMIDERTVLGCRKYCGLGTDSEHIYLKYYDCQDYEGNEPIRKEGELSVMQMNARNTELYPYQKIEYFAPNSVVNSTRHKSNFFSVRLCNTTIGTQTGEQFGQLRKDITNAIREICDNVAPANTQLLDVQFSVGGR